MKTQKTKDLPEKDNVKTLNIEPLKSSYKQGGDEPKIARIERYLKSKYDIRFNEVANKTEVKEKDKKEYEVLNDKDIYVELLYKGFTKCREDLNALLGSSRITKYDPFKSYFEALPAWNESEPDYIHQLCSYVKINDQSWFNLMFKKFLVRVVAQSICEIPFNKQCLTLVGKQNDGKTTLLEFLVPEKLKEYYKKGFTFGGNKDGQISLVQNFIINLDELASFDKKELNNEFKTLLSESIVKFRPLYQTSEVANKRRCSFLASTNQKEFLTDETGNVRWLVFAIDSIDFNYSKKVDMDLVYSQAYYLLKNGFEFEMNKAEIQVQEEINRNFQRNTVEMELITKYFESAEKGVEHAEFMQSNEIQSYILANTQHVRISNVMLGRGLAILGYPKISGRSKTGQNAYYGYWVVKKI